MNPPANWIKGQLLDLHRFADGHGGYTYTATLLGEEPDQNLANFMNFDCSQDAQAFISNWYQREPQVRYG
jgi:hypothetical protein